MGFGGGGGGWGYTKDRCVTTVSQTFNDKIDSFLLAEFMKEARNMFLMWGAVRRGSIYIGNAPSVWHVFLFATKVYQQPVDLPPTHDVA